MLVRVPDQATAFAQSPHPVFFFLLNMASTLCAKLLPKQAWLPLTQCIRHGSKAVTRHRRPVHFLKKKLLAVTRHIAPPVAAPPGAYPPTETRVREHEHPLAPMKKKMLEEVFKDNKMIAVVQNNSSTAEDIMMLKYRLHKHGIQVKFFPNKVVRSFLSESIYSNMAPLFIGPMALIVSEQPKVKQMLSSLRSSPQITLLGACIDNTLLSVQGVMNYSKLPPVTVVQGELVSSLTMLTSQTAALLQRHPAHLSALLQQYVQQQSSGVSTEGGPAAEEAT